MKLLLNFFFHLHFHPLIRLVNSVDRPFAVFVEVQVIDGHFAFSGVLEIFNTGEVPCRSQLFAPVAVVGNAGVKFAVKFAEVSEGKQGFNLARLGVPTAENCPCVTDIAVIVASDGTNTAIRLFHSNCARCSHYYFSSSL